MMGWGPLLVLLLVLIHQCLKIKCACSIMRQSTWESLASLNIVLFTVCAFSQSNYLNCTMLSMAKPYYHKKHRQPEAQKCYLLPGENLHGELQLQFPLPNDNKQELGTKKLLSFYGLMEGENWLRFISLIYTTILDMISEVTPTLKLRTSHGAGTVCMSRNLRERHERAHTCFHKQMTFSFIECSSSQPHR